MGESEKTADTPAEDPKSYIKTVVAGNERLRFLAVTAKNGWRFYVQQQEKQGKNTKTTNRGASQSCATLAEASALVDQGVKNALANGWTLPVRVGGGGGFKAKEDAFSLNSLPKPKAASAPATAEAAPAAPAPAQAAPAKGKGGKQTT